MSAQSTFINALLNASFKGQTYTGGAITIGLFKAGLPSTTGVEVSGGSYQRQALTFNDAAEKSISTATSAVFIDVPPSNEIVAFGIYSDGVLIDEDLLPTPFKSSVTNNELKINYSFELEV